MSTVKRPVADLSLEAPVLFVTPCRVILLPKVRKFAREDGEAEVFAEVLPFARVLLVVAFARWEAMACNITIEPHGPPSGTGCVFVDWLSGSMVEGGGVDGEVGCGVPGLEVP